jgi:hypothetical protein
MVSVAKLARTCVTVGAIVLATLFLGYGYGRILLTAQAYRAANMLLALHNVQPGQPATSLTPLLNQYEDRRYESEMGVDQDTHVIRVDPWHFYSSFGRVGWVAAPIRDVLAKSGNWRRNLGLRLWVVDGSITVKEGYIQTITLLCQVEGENEWLLALWSYLPEFSQDDLARRGSQNDLPPEMSRYRVHWTHVHMGNDTGEGIVNSVIPLADSEELNAARTIDMRCLTSMRGCRSLCDLMPDANRYRHEHNYVGWGWNSGSWGVQPRDCE